MNYGNVDRRAEVANVYSNPQTGLSRWICPNHCKPVFLQNRFMAIIAVCE